MSYRYNYNYLFTHACYFNDIFHQFNYIIPKVIVNEIVKYAYNKCVCCNKYLIDEHMCMACNSTYCLHDYIIMVIKDGCRKCHNHKNVVNILKYVNCKNCYNVAEYGYKDIICYCLQCSKNKKVIKYYTKCMFFHCPYMALFFDSKPVCILHSTSYYDFHIDFRSNILTNEIVSKCINCNLGCNVLFECSCGKLRCYKCTYVHCSYICWPSINKIVVCNNCITEYNYTSQHAITYLNFVCDITSCNNIGTYSGFKIKNNYQVPVFTCKQHMLVDI